MDRLFVDTGAWFAFFVRSDPDHERVARTLERCQGRLVSSEYVFDELVTLLRNRVSHRDAVTVGEALRGGEVASLVSVGPRDVQGAWRIFSSQSDKRYSFTDCTSFALMRRLGLDTAVAVDGHFRQAGFVVLP